MPFPHTLNLYQKPALGNAYINRFPVYNYRHTIAAVGGFDSASCDIAIRSREEGQQFLDQYIGNRVAFYVDNPVEPIWEGFINRMTFSAGGVQYTISLDEMSNRATLTYINGAVSATQPQESTTFNDTNSQNRYGIKQETIDLGYQSTVGTALANYANTRAVQKAWPKTSIIQGQGNGLLHLEMLGFYHTLEWETWRNLTNTAIALNTLLTTIIGACVNGTTFFDNSVTSGIAANTLTLNQFKIRSQTLWELILEVTEMANASFNYMISGITPTSFQTGLRTFYYRQFNSAVEYTARQSDGLRIRNKYRQLVDPWRVQPDRGVRVSDMLIGWDGLGDNPTETYIFKVDYDANRQIATWRGDDDQTAEGAYQLNRFGKPRGKRFGSPLRLL